VDIDLRELERRTASGCEQAGRKLRAARRRIGIRSIRKGNKMITDLVGASVKYTQEKIYGYSGSPKPDPFYEKEGTVTSAYVPHITGKGDSAYSESSKMRLVVEIEGQLLDRPVDYFSLVK
jgi:hypothetical protein